MVVPVWTIRRQSDIQVTQSFREIAKSLGVGRLLYYTYHRPAEVLETINEKGLGKVLAVRRARKRMFEAVDQLPRISFKKPDDLVVKELTFLTGAKYWAMTAFCAHSFMQRAQCALDLRILDDGTLKDQHIATIKRIFPHVRVQRKAELDQIVHESLPDDEYTALTRRRREYPHLRKIVDAHLGKEGFRLVLDSDMLFWGEVPEILHWMHNPSQPLYMRDSETSYGYPIQYLSQLCGREIRSEVNVGMTGFNSSAINWYTIENWCGTMLKDHGSSYYQEQALFAMMIAEHKPVELPVSRYICSPREGDLKAEEICLAHYVNEAQDYYFLHEWKRYLNELS